MHVFQKNRWLLAKNNDDCVWKKSTIAQRVECFLQAFLSERQRTPRPLFVETSTPFQDPCHLYKHLLQHVFNKHFVVLVT